MFVFDAMTDTAILIGRTLCTDDNTKAHYLVTMGQGRNEAKKSTSMFCVWPKEKSTITYPVTGEPEGGVSKSCIPSLLPVKEETWHQYIVMHLLPGPVSCLSVYQEMSSKTRDLMWIFLVLNVPYVWIKSAVSCWFFNCFI